MPRRNGHPLTMPIFAKRAAAAPQVLSEAVHKRASQLLVGLILATLIGFVLFRRWREV
jgi:hypothetical protein